jgi:hypothetical protein
MCYASFTAVPDANDGKTTYYSYYRAAAVGIFLLGTATLVATKRKIVCASCLDEATIATTTSSDDKYVREVDETCIAVAS